MRFCPSCTEPIEDGADTCPHCGKGFSTVTPERNAKALEEGACGRRQKIVSAVLGRLSDARVFKAVMAASVVLAVVFVGCSLATVASEDYRLYASKYGECMYEYQSNLAMAGTYNRDNIYGYGLATGFENVADTYKDLAEMYMGMIWGLRIRAIVLAVLGVVCVAAFAYMFRNRRRIVERSAKETMLPADKS